MTLSVRRILLTILFVPALVGLLASSAVWFGWFSGVYALETPSTTAIWWGSIRAAGESEVFWALVLVSFYVVFGLLGELILRRGFGRSPSPEMFFLRVFLLTLPFQFVRLAVPGVLDGLLTGSVGLVATRVAWFGRFAGITALLNISLYSTDMPFRRSSSIVGMGALASMAVAVMLPLDITQPMANLLYRSGADTALALSCLSLEVLAVLSLAGVAAGRMNNRYYALAGALFLIIAGFDISFFAYRSMVIPGAIFMVSGLAVFAFQVQKIYQWL